MTLENQNFSDFVKIWTYISDDYSELSNIAFVRETGTKFGGGGGGRGGLCNQLESLSWGKWEDLDL